MSAAVRIKASLDGAVVAVELPERALSVAALVAALAPPCPVAVEHQGVRMTDASLTAAVAATREHGHRALHVTLVPVASLDEEAPVEAVGAAQAQPRSPRVVEVRDGFAEAPRPRHKVRRRKKKAARPSEPPQSTSTTEALMLSPRGAAEAPLSPRIVVVDRFAEDAAVRPRRRVKKKRPPRLADKAVVEPMDPLDREIAEAKMRAAAARHAAPALVAVPAAPAAATAARPTVPVMAPLPPTSPRAARGLKSPREWKLFGGRSAGASPAGALSPRGDERKFFSVGATRVKERPSAAAVLGVPPTLSRDQEQARIVETVQRAQAASAVGQGPLQRDTEQARLVEGAREPSPPPSPAGARRGSQSPRLVRRGSLFRAAAAEETASAPRIDAESPTSPPAPASPRSSRFSREAGASPLFARFGRRDTVPIPVAAGEERAVRELLDPALFDAEDLRRSHVAVSAEEWQLDDDTEIVVLPKPQ